MKLYVRYQTQIGGWRRNQVETDYLYYFDAGTYKHVRNWGTLLFCIQKNFPLVVLQDHPIPTRDGFDYDDFISKIEYVINSSKILFVEPKEEVDLEEAPQDSVYVDQYLSEEEKKKRKERMERLARHLGKPR